MFEVKSKTDSLPKLCQKNQEFLALERRSSNPIYKVEATDNQGFGSDLAPDSEYLTDALGTQVGVLVDPRSRTMEVYRPGVEQVVLRDGDVLTVPELLPGW
jgi:hypothetical protein